MPSSRPPPRLRTKSGCDQCKRRKKKCNEGRPSCESCLRLKLRCAWATTTQLPQRPSSLSGWSSILPQARHISSTDASTISLRDHEGPLSLATTAGSFGAIPSTARRSLSLSDYRTPPAFTLHSSIPRSPSYYAPGLRNSRDHLLFSLFVKKLMPLLLRSYAHPRFHDGTYVLSIGLNSPWVMDAFLALSAFYQSYQDPSLRLVAMNYYNVAVHGLRSNIQALSGTDVEDALLVSVIFLGLFEEWLSDSFDGVIFHFQAAAQILQLRLKTTAANTTTLPFHCIAAESVVWHLSSLVLFHKDLDALARTISWPDLEVYLEHEPPSSTPEFANSPLLGSFKLLYRLAFETTRLSRHIPLNEPEQLQASCYQSKLDDLVSALFPNSLSLHHPSFNPSTIEPSLSVSKATITGEEMHNLSASLWILAVRIYLTKVQHPDNSHSTSPDIRAWISQAISLLSSPVAQASINGPFGEHLCWPLIIFACGSNREEHVKLIRNVLETMWSTSFCGQVKRMERVVEGIWSAVGKNRTCECRGTGRRSRANSDGWKGSGEGDESYGIEKCRCGPEGLDILIQNGGLGWLDAASVCD